MTEIPMPETQFGILAQRPGFNGLEILLERKEIGSHMDVAIDHLGMRPAHLRGTILRCEPPIDEDSLRSLAMGVRNLPGENDQIRLGNPVRKDDPERLLVGKLRRMFEDAVFGQGKDGGRVGNPGVFLKTGSMGLATGKSGPGRKAGG